MNRQAIFNTPEQAITVTFRMLMRLGMFVSWTLFGIAHLAIAVIVLWAFWLFGITPESAGAFFLEALATRPAATLAAAGVSATGLIACYWKFAKALHRKTADGWLFEYLIQDVVQK